MKKTLFLTLCFFICLPASRTIAQDIARIADILRPYGLTPEVMMLDPVYDPDCRLSGYSLASIVKIEFTPPAAVLPEAKSVYIWDRGVMEWNKYLEYVSEYDEQMRIVSETIFKIDPYSGYKRSLAPETTQDYAYTREGSVETVTIRIKYHHSGQVMLIYDEDEEKKEDDDVYVVIEKRHLNSFGKPDSIINQMASGQEYNKLVYEYDGRQRPVGIKAFYRGEDIGDEYVCFLETRVEYGKNRIICTQQGTPEFYDYLRDMYGYGDSDGLTDILFRGAFEYLLEFDKDDRLVFKSMEVGGEPILTARYNYDSRGRQNADVEIHVNTAIHVAGDILPSGILREFRDWKMFAYNTGYDEQGYRTTRLYVKDPNGNKTMLGTVVDKADDSGRTLHFDLTRYYPEDGEFNDRNLVIYSYTDEEDGSTLIDKTEYHTSEEDDIYENGYGREVVRTDSRGRITYEETYDYSYSEQEWYPEYRKTFRYDTFGNLEYEETMKYDRRDEKWEGRSCENYIRDDQGRVVYNEKYAWRDGRWRDDKKFTYAYDIDGNKTLWEEMRYVVSDSRWIGIDKLVGEYDADGEPTLEISHAWSRDQEQWVPARKIEYLRDPYSIETTNYRWSEGKWLPTDRTYQLQKMRGSQELISNSLEWSVEKSDWIPRHMTRKWQQDQNTWIEQNYQWDYPADKLRGYKYIITSYLPESTTVIYHVWEEVGDQWKPFARYTQPGSDQKRTPDREVQTLELYDVDSDCWEKSLMLEKKYARTDDEYLFDSEGTVYQWDGDSQKWIPQFTIATKGDRGDETSSRAEYFSYGLSGDRKKVALRTEQDYNQRIFWLWNESGSAYEPFYKSDFRGWSVRNFLWDAESGEWKDYEPNYLYREVSPEETALRARIEEVRGFFMSKIEEKMVEGFKDVSEFYNYFP